MIYNKDFMGDHPLVKQLITYDETDSTNVRAKELISQGVGNGTLILADRQTQGRGRMGRSFSSPAGDGIYMSLILTPPLAPEKCSMLTLIAALSACRALDSVSGLHTQIKWPNDIICEGKKLVGILTEYIPVQERDYVVIGVGMNINNREFPAELKKAGSLFSLTGKAYDREVIILHMWTDFCERYNAFLKTGDLSVFRQEYEDRLIHMNREVFLIPTERTAAAGSAEEASLEGLAPVYCTGISANGALVCKNPDGSEFSVSAGEISLRY